jgi:hypothetical protein
MQLFSNVVVTCPTLRNIPAAMTSTDDVTYDAEVNITCDTGYEFDEGVDTHSVRCQSSGRWSHDGSHWKCLRNCTAHPKMFTNTAATKILFAVLFSITLLHKSNMRDMHLCDKDTIDFIKSDLSMSCSFQRQALFVQNRTVPLFTFAYSLIQNH